MTCGLSLEKKAHAGTWIDATLQTKPKTTESYQNASLKLSLWYTMKTVITNMGESNYLVIRAHIAIYSSKVWLWEWFALTPL